MRGGGPVLRTGADRSSKNVRCFSNTTHSQCGLIFFFFASQQYPTQQLPTGEVVQNFVMDGFRGLSSPSMDVRTKVMELCLPLVSSKNSKEVVALLKKELIKTCDKSDKSKRQEYRKLLIKALHVCTYVFGFFDTLSFSLSFSLCFLLCRRLDANMRYVSISNQCVRCAHADKTRECCFHNQVLRTRRRMRSPLCSC